MGCNKCCCGAQKLDPVSSLYQPGMAKVWATLDVETRDRLLECADESAAGLTLQSLQQAQQQCSTLAAQASVSGKYSLDALVLSCSSPS